MMSCQALFFVLATAIAVTNASPLRNVRDGGTSFTLTCSQEKKIVATLFVVADKDEPNGTYWVFTTLLSTTGVSDRQGSVAVSEWDYGHFQIFFSRLNASQH
jgi:hypothetical protein